MVSRNILNTLEEVMKVKEEDFELYKKGLERFLDKKGNERVSDEILRDLIEDLVVTHGLEKGGIEVFGERFANGVLLYLLNVKGVTAKKVLLSADPDLEEGFQYVFKRHVEDNLMIYRK